MKQVRLSQQELNLLFADFVLPLLRAAGDAIAPEIALTVTAPPTVQADIRTQLGMVNPKKFIHGFRRENLAIDVVEVSMPLRFADYSSHTASSKARNPIGDGMPVNRTGPTYSEVLRRCRCGQRVGRRFRVNPESILAQWAFQGIYSVRRSLFLAWL
jgi:hypothetical protein